MTRAFTAPRPASISAAVVAPYRVYVTLDGPTHTEPFWTLAEAQEYADAYQHAHCLNKDAIVSIWEGDSIRGRYVHSWRGGQVQGPRDVRHPMRKLFDMAVRSGANITVGGFAS